MKLLRVAEIALVSEWRFDNTSAIQFVAANLGLPLPPCLAGAQRVLRNVLKARACSPRMAVISLMGRAELALYFQRPETARTHCFAASERLVTPELGVCDELLKFMACMTPNAVRLLGRGCLDLNPPGRLTVIDDSVARDPKWLAAAVLLTQPFAALLRAQTCGIRLMRALDNSTPPLFPMFTSELLPEP